MSVQPDADGLIEDVTRAADLGVALTVMIGPYRLVQRIGEGGMGEVWLAEQKSPVRRQVALKVIKAGMDTAHVVARFEAERQALAMMDHPAIAKVLDAGGTPHGRPYFVMEYVPGEPITTYCNRHKLSTRDRLDLFLQVCDGVHHAHQRGIIHRDLKPSNILLTMLDARPVPKIIDFGLAKAIAQTLTDRTLYTELGTLMGTLEYMSPEQAEMTGLDIDTRTDVYALGVILYELLTGVLPFDAKQLRDKGFDEIRRTIREVEPPRPSARVAPGSTLSPPSLRADVAGLAQELRGDLDWITMRAIEKDRTRRFGSAADLAADVRRHFDHLPVTASPPSTLYRIRKFARRHRVGMSVAATLATVLVAFTTTTAIQARRVAQERDRANQEAEIARAVNEFLQNDLLAQASVAQQARPDIKPDPDLKVRTALDRAAARIQGKFERQPLVGAAIRQTIGATYGELGLFAEAQQQFERALELRRRVLGEKHTDTLKSVNDLAFLYRRQGKFEQAEPLMANALEAHLEVYGEEHAATLETMNNLAGLYREQGKYGEAERLFERALNLRHRIHGEESPETLVTMNDLGLLYWTEGKLTQADAMYNRALEIRQRVSGKEHPETLTVMGNLGTLYYRQGEYARAEPLLRELLEIRRRLQGSEHPSTLVAMNNLAMTYKARGQYGLAEPLLLKTLDLRRRVLGETHPNTLRTKHNLGMLYVNEGRHRESEGLLSEVLDARSRVLGTQHPETTETVTSLARVRVRRGKYREAELLLREAPSSCEATAADSWERYNCESVLGASLAGQKKYAQAESLLIAGHAGMTRRKATVSADRWSDLEETGTAILQLYQDWRQHDKTAEWRQKLQR